MSARYVTAAGCIAIALGALLARFWNLSTQPGGLYPDEAAQGVFAQRILNQPGYHPIFIDEDAGNEATFAYIAAAAFRVFGASTTVLRGTAAALGVAGVIAIWLAARRFGPGVALAAMAWAAGSLWLIAISRDGFRNVLTIGFGALAVAALINWGERPSRVSGALAGAAAAAGLWAYAPLKLLPVLAILWLLWISRVDRERHARMRGTLRWALLGYAVVALPMLWTAVSDFNNFFGRSASVSAVGSSGASVDGFPLHTLKTLAMFLATGDPNERHDVNALPLLGPVLFIPFAAGVWAAWRRRRDHAYALVLLGLPVFLLPPLLATEGTAPHFLRSLGLAPYVAICVGLGCAEIVAAAHNAPRAWRAWAAPAAAALCALALAALGALSLRAYLDRPLAARFDAYSFADVQLAAVADGGPGTAVIVDDYNAYDVRFLDASALPTIVPPAQHIANAAVFSLVVAPTRADLTAALGAATAGRANVAAVDPSGNPTVWQVAP